MRNTKQSGGDGREEREGHLHYFLGPLALGVACHLRNKGVNRRRRRRYVNVRSMYSEE